MGRNKWGRSKFYYDPIYSTPFIRPHLFGNTGFLVYDSFWMAFSGSLAKKF